MRIFLEPYPISLTKLRDSPLNQFHFYCPSNDTKKLDFIVVWSFDFWSLNFSRPPLAIWFGKNGSKMKTKALTLEDFEAANVSKTAKILFGANNAKQNVPGLNLMKSTLEFKARLGKMHGLFLFWAELVDFINSILQATHRRTSEEDSRMKPVRKKFF